MCDIAYPHGLKGFALKTVIMNMRRTMNSDTGYRQPFDAALLAFSILKRLGVGEVDTFAHRLVSQKVQYLAQVFGVTPNYPFNLYVRGPYSPDLAHDLYRIQSQGLKPDTSAFIPEELEEKFSKLKVFIADKSPRQLELVASMHWLLNVSKFSTDEAKKMLAEWKGADETEYSYVTDELAKL